jgi:hypothetical protein
MSRALSAGTMDALFAQETGECFLYLVEVNHADFAQPLRITNNAVDVVSNGDTYQNYPLKMTLPKDDPEPSGDCSVPRFSNQSHLRRVDN